MAFCTNKKTPLKDLKQANHLIARAKEKGFQLDGGFANYEIGWHRRIRPVTSFNWDQKNHPSKTAPGARWIQIEWSHKKDKCVATLTYHVCGLTRNNRNEQLPHELCQHIRVRKFQAGPQNQHSSWMALYGREKNVDPGAIIFEGGQTATVNQFSHLKWNPQQNPNTPLGGYWSDEENNITYVPEPLLPTDNQPQTKHTEPLNNQLPTHI